MKNFALLCLLVSITSIASAQSDSSGTKVFTFVEQIPEYPGGDGELIRFLQQNIRYPQMERDNDIQGKVLLRFVIDETGAVGDVVVVRSVSPGLDAESVRVVKMMPKFKPGKQQGKAVKVYFNLPVVYKLQDNDQILMRKIGEQMSSDKQAMEGIAQYKKNNYAGAIKAFSKSVARSPNALTYAMLAECYKITSDKANRCKALAKAVDMGYTDDAQELKRECK